MKIDQKGQTLIESLVALTVIIAVVTSIATLVINALFNSQFVRDQNLANKFSEEGMEAVRNIQISSLLRFQNFTSSPGITTSCFNSTLTNLVACGSMAGNPIPGQPSYVRKVTLERAGSGCIVGETKVIVTTSWASSKCASGDYCHNSQLVSCLVHDKGITP